MRHLNTLKAALALAFGALILSACSGTPNITAANAPSNEANSSQLGDPGGPSMKLEAAHYTVVPLGTLSGNVDAGISITEHGIVSGFATLSGNTVVHAAVWSGHGAVDLGTLGGANSAVEWPNHDESEVVGISQTSMVDPLGEHWSCSAFIPFTGNTCLGFVSSGSGMTPLPTLGGNNGYASGANASGQVVGWAENSTHDPTCKVPQVLQFEAVIWGPNDQIEAQLPPIRHDLDTAATAINDNGDVVGISGICQNAVGALSAKHAILWQNGVPTDIGSLGGAGWNTPTAINDRGAIAGFSDLAGDDHAKNPNYHAFYWTRHGGMVDLGVLPGDTVSQAFGMNNHGEVVGQTCTTPACTSSRAFIWQGGVMTDLNSLVSCGSLFLVFANDINDRGVITGLGVDANGNAFAYRAIPSDGSQTAAGSARRLCERPMKVPASIRRFTSHFGGGA